MATFQEHLDNMTAVDVMSANKALDYLDGDQIKWLESLLDGHADVRSNELTCGPSGRAGGIKDWRKRGVYPWITNLTKKIVTRSALSYNKAPGRFVLNDDDTENDDATETYRGLLEGGDFDNVMDCADSVCRLLKNVIILAQAVEVVDEEEKILFSVLHRGNCDVDFDHQNGTIRSLMFQSAGTSARGNKLFHFWDDKVVIDIEDIDGNLTAGPPDEHGFGMIPAAILWDTFKPRAGFWPKNSWDELIRFNEGTNLYHTEVKFNQRFQTFGALFSTATIPDGAVIGPDTIVELEGSPGVDVFLEYKAPTINLETFEKWLEGFKEDIADNWGVNLSTGGSGSADSGFKLVVEEVWNLTTREGRLKAARSFEGRMYTVIKAISQAREFGLPQDSEVKVDFPEPSLPVNTKEEWDITKEKIGIQFLTREDAWRAEDPDISEATIAERKQALGILAAVPTFGNIVDEGN